MKSHLDYLRERGFEVASVGQDVTVFPLENLTPSLRLWINLHRSELLAELAAGVPARHCVWRVYLRGEFVCTAVSEPMSLDEVRKRVRFPGAEVRP